MKDFIKWMGYSSASFGIAFLTLFFVISLMGSIVQDSEYWGMSFIFLGLAGVILIERIVKYLSRD